MGVGCWRWTWEVVTSTCPGTIISHDVFFVFIPLLANCLVLCDRFIVGMAGVMDIGRKRF